MIVYVIMARTSDFGGDIRDRIVTSYTEESQAKVHLLKLKKIGSRSHLWSREKQDNPKCPLDPQMDCGRDGVEYKIFPVQCFVHFDEFQETLGAMK